jgi:hypothetical protein
MECEHIAYRLDLLLMWRGPHLCIVIHIAAAVLIALDQLGHLNCSLTDDPRFLIISSILFFLHTFLLPSLASVSYALVAKNSPTSHANVSPSP